MSEAKVLTNDSLKDIMTDSMAVRQLPQYTPPLDLNSITQTGIYLLNGQSVINGPSGYVPLRGVLRVYNAYETQNTKYLVQELTSPLGDTLRRTMWYTDWNQWRKVADTVIGGGKTLHFFRKRAERRVAA